MIFFFSFVFNSFPIGCIGRDTHGWICFFFCRIVVRVRLRQWARILVVPTFSFLPPPPQHFVVIEKILCGINRHPFLSSLVQLRWIDYIFFFFKKSFTSKQKGIRLELCPESKLTNARGVAQSNTHTTSSFCSVFIVQEFRLLYFYFLGFFFFVFIRRLQRSTGHDDGQSPDQRPESNSRVKRKVVPILSRETSSSHFISTRRANAVRSKRRASGLSWCLWEEWSFPRLLASNWVPKLGQQQKNEQKHDECFLHLPSTKPHSVSSCCVFFVACHPSSRD